MTALATQTALPLRTPKALRFEGPAFQNRTFHKTMFGFSALFLLTAVLCLEFFRCKLPLVCVAPAATRLLPLLLLAGYGWWTRSSRLLQISLLLCWAGVMVTLFKFPVYLAARSRMPLQDSTLARLDHLLGVGTPFFLRVAARHPMAGNAIGVCYDLLVPLMLLAATLPALRGRWRAAKEYLIGTCLAALFGAFLFAFFPSVGPWTADGFAPSVRQQQCQRLLVEFRSPAMHTLTLRDAAIIGFPSFHVIFAILSATALASIKPLRIPAAILAALICLSTLTTGWHYLSDVAGGITVALLSLAAAKMYSKLEHRLENAPPDTPPNRGRRGRGGKPAFAKRRGLCGGNAGQSLIEVALFVPIFTMLVCYAVDFGYFFLASTTLDAAGRNAIGYAIQGTKSPAQAAEPAASSVAALAVAAIGLPNVSSSASVQVCSNSVSSPSLNNVAQCQTFGADTSLSYTADVDPESPTFQLNRVDVIYTVSPPIPLPSAILPSLTFHRYVEMRAIQ